MDHDDHILNSPEQMHHDPHEGGHAQDTGGPGGDGQHAQIVTGHQPQRAQWTMGTSIDSEALWGRRFPYQEDLSLVEDVDLVAATPGADINWLEDVDLLQEEGIPAVFDRYSNCFLKIHFPIPAGRENEIARKVLIKHLQEGNSYGIRMKEKHAKFPQPELGPWVPNSRTVGENYTPPVLEGWEPPVH